MFKRFLWLEWKQFARSSHFQRGIVVNIFLILFALYFILSFLALGTGAYFMLKKGYPDQDPLVIVNNFILFWFLADLGVRFFMQKLPVMNIKPFMMLPVKRKTVIHFLLTKTTTSFFNFLPLFFFIPFSIVLLIHGYPPLNVIAWFFSMLFFTLSVNYLNFLINKINLVFFGIAALLIIGFLLEVYGIYRISEPAGVFFNNIYNKPYAVLIPLLLMILLYRRNYAFARKGFYLDEKISETSKERKTSDLSWLNRFGAMAPFLRNDLRLIWRNKRPKKVLFTGVFFLFYGAFVINIGDKAQQATFLPIIASLLVSGGFMMTFGQLVPSWDSEYYKLLMSQNIPYRKYLESKWYLMVVATIISFILATPYLYFGLDLYLMFAAGAVFNIGYMSFATLYTGVYNRVPVELNAKAKAFANLQSFSAVQFLLVIPKLLVPFLVFYVPYYFWGMKAGMFAFVGVGILGILLKKPLLNSIEKVYQKQKYKTIAAFEEKA